MPDERILVVDDEDLIREIICSILTQAGFKCKPIRSGTDALTELKSEAGYSVVVSDVVMEGMDGLTLLSKIKAAHPDIPVVMVTAIHDISVALAAIRNGAYDYLLKPFEREQLLASVRRAVENRRLKLENLAYQTKLESLVSARTDLLRQALSDLERSYDITLEALGDALDLKDAETEGHSKRVTGFTIAIARAMDLPHDKVRVIARGAFLHDVGKMAIPDAILRKPGRLSPEEQEIMKQHALLGYQMLKKIPFLHEAADIVYSHQERFDGSRVSPRIKGRPDSSRGAHICRGRHLRRRHLRPPLSRRAVDAFRRGAKLNASRANSSIPRSLKSFSPSRNASGRNCAAQIEAQSGAKRYSFGKTARN